jgi:hypothetical protein
MRSVFTVIVTVVLLGCERSPHSPVSAGFVNQTQHSDAELQAICTEDKKSATAYSFYQPELTKYAAS